MIRVGPAGWSYADWEGIVYPRRKPPGFHALRHLSRYVDLVEVNSSFYATPRADWCESWLGFTEENRRFRFTAKLQSVFTHQPLPDSPERLEALAGAYRRGIEPLRAAGKLAALLVQFPLGFRFTESGVERLRKLRDLFDAMPLVLEVRHRSWFEPRGLDSIDRLGYSLARIDLPPAPDHPPETWPPVGPIGYLRLHGRNAAAWFDPRAGRDRRYDHLYGLDELRELTRLTKRLAEGVDETYVVTNNHFAGKAVANALELVAAIGEDVPRAPIELVETYPRLRSCTRADGQPTLFQSEEPG